MVKKTETETNSLIINDEHGTQIANYSSEAVETIKNTVAKGANDSELYMFLETASKYDLNPFMKEIWFMKIKGTATIMTSRDGFLKIAKQDPNFKKCQSVAVYENDKFEMEYDMGDLANITHKFTSNDRGKVIGAYAVLKTYTGDELATYMDFKEYDQRNSIWKKYPSAMIRKVAENDVLKRFANISGVVPVEDMGNEYTQMSLNNDCLDIRTLVKE